jgi:hypothetical protein
MQIEMPDGRRIVFRPHPPDKLGDHLRVRARDSRPVTVILLDGEELEIPPGGSVIIKAVLGADDTLRWRFANFVIPASKLN